MRRFVSVVSHLLHVAWSAGVGVGYRALRRLVRRPPRIWHGFFPIISIPDLVTMDRMTGYPTRSVIYSTRVFGYSLLTADLFDRVLEDEGVPVDERHWVTLADLLWHADVWVTNFDCLFFPQEPRKNDLVLRLIRLMGVRIVVAPHGTDVHQLHVSRDRYDWVSRLAEDYPNWDFEAQSGVSRRRVELFSKHAHFVISADTAVDPFLTRSDLRFKYFPVDTRRLQPAVAINEVPVVVHAPNHRHVKGTEYLLEAIERLKASAIGVELRMVENVARRQALGLYAGADIIADQFVIGAFGSFAVEGLALGKPVLTYLSGDHLRDPVLNLPIVNCSSVNLDRVIAALVLVPQLRARLGEAGRKAVERYQSYEAIGEVWDRIYGHVWWGKPLALESTRHFAPERMARALTEDPERSEFWPVDAVDLMPQVRRAIARVVT